MTGMFACCGSNGIADTGTSKIDYGPKDGGVYTTHGGNCFRTKGGSLAISQQNAEISGCLAGTRRCGIKNHNYCKSSNVSVDGKSDRMSRT